MILTLLIVGETGAGKSSLINKLANQDLARVSSGATLCTESWSEYRFQVNSIEVHAYDSVGFGSACTGSSSSLIPYEAALDMLRSFKIRVDLVFLCTKRDKLSPITQHLYHFFNDFFFNGTVPISLIVTHRGEKRSMDDWWSQHQDQIKSYGFAGHAFITISHKSAADRRKQSKESVVKLLSTSYKRRTLDKPAVPLFDRLTNGTDVLTKKCGLSPRNALFLTRKANLHIRIPNIVLFGAAGVGKSSVINLIAEEKIAGTSGGADACTLDSTEYRLNVEESCLRIFDTVGLNSPDIGGGDYVDAIQKAITLIKMLKRVGGVDLLLFCIDGGRVLTHHQTNYNLFWEGLGHKKIPVAILVTRLEHEKEMEKWWTKNAEFLAKLKIKCEAHACITTISEDVEGYGAKRDESRQRVLELLKEKVKDCGEPFIMDSDEWLSGFLKKMRSFVKKERPSKRIVQQELRKGLSKGRAEDIAKAVCDRA